MASIEQIKPLIESKLKELGYELFDLRFFHAGSRSILRVTIDSDKAITISDCETVSNSISELLDQEDFSSNCKYNLEISSPGIDRPLKTERDFKRVIGHPVIVYLKEGIEGKKKIQGEILSCEGNKLRLKNEHNILEVSLSDIFSGKEEIRFK
ncbi:MAG TPA: ribosome maturation factor RimP [Chitinispirillaceae bacterium]|nr:ribosome maturation factor RimP [Chitinispirillaceae bacterium]